MVSSSSERDAPASAMPTPVKIIIAGGFGTGKTTMVSSVSEIPPLSTEETMTTASAEVDDTTGIENKVTTTVALDFGRITISPQTVLYLFGTPGQNRFWFMWDELARGAIGAIVLIDTRRLDSSFPAIDFFERRQIPFMVAVNRFPGAYAYDDDTLRERLAISGEVPITSLDAREREQSKLALIRLVRHALTKVPEPSVPA